jgi:carbon-monoxide dehydrogenase medium subunit
MSYVNLESDGELRIGAMTRQREVEIDPIVENICPLLHEVMPSIAHAQIRNRGTIGGSLVHADPAAELPVIMVALDGRFRLRSIQGKRWVQARDFFQGILTTAIEPEEIMDEVAVPKLPDRSGTSFLEFARRKGDYALIGVAVVVTFDRDQLIQGARIVYLNAGDTPMVAEDAAAMLIGQQPSQELFIEAAAYAVDNEIDPMGDIHATVQYRKHLARILTKRALIQAQERII